jgi:oligoendopeptidase F
VRLVPGLHAVTHGSGPEDPSMRSLSVLLFALVPLVLMVIPPLVAQTRTRESIPEAYRWNLAELYPDDTAWAAEKERLAAEIPQASGFKGTLADGAAQMTAALDAQAAQVRRLQRLFVYAGLAADQDTRVAKNQGLVQQMSQLAAQFGAAWAFLEPEILAMDPAIVERFVAQEPRLSPYRQYLRDVLRRKPHTRTEAEEQLIALTGPMAAGASGTAGVFLNADLPYPTVKLADGHEVRLDVSGFTAARASANRDDRRKVMEAFFGTLSQFNRTLGAAMNTNVEQAVFQTKARRYGSSLERALDESSIPVAVYHELVAGVNRHLPAFHRYLQLRKRMLGVDALHYYDLYAPLVANVPLEYTVEQARTQIRDAVAILGPDYVQALDMAFDGRWMDLYPATGKRSGAYMNGSAYDVHPYLLLNYNGQYTDMSTLAHELGHAMHSWFSNQTQPFPTASYPIFVAEVASTFNEALLVDRMLQQITDPNVRLSVLGNYLEGLKGTVFRQTQFAEFELRMHEMGEKGQPITGEALSRLYLEITRRYYGHDAGICTVDDYVAHEWEFITHFYNPFYVYQYATSFTASSALSEKVLAREPGAVERYRAFIAAGGSKYPIELLKDAGVDMTSREPLDLTIQKMNRVMDEMDKLLAR